MGAPAGSHVDALLGRAGCRPPWYARWATTAARDVPAPRRPRTARARAAPQARQAGLLGVGGLAPPARGQLRHAGAFGQQQPHGADHGRIGQAIELIDDAFSQIARGRGAVDHRLHVQRRRAPGDARSAPRTPLPCWRNAHTARPWTGPPAARCHPSSRPRIPKPKLLQRRVKYLRDPQSRRKPAPLSPHGPTPEQNGSIKTDWPVANLTLIRNDQDRLGTMTANPAIGRRRRRNRATSPPHASGRLPAAQARRRRLKHACRPHPIPAWASKANTLDTAARAMARWTGGLSPAAGLLAWTDWASHLACAPGKQAELASLAFGRATGPLPAARHGGPGAGRPARDRRYAGEGWRQWPYNLWSEGFLAAQQWWNRPRRACPAWIPITRSWRPLPRASGWT